MRVDRLSTCETSCFLPFDKYCYWYRTLLLSLSHRGYLKRVRSRLRHNRSCAIFSLFLFSLLFSALSLSHFLCSRWKMLINDEVIRNAHIQHLPLHLCVLQCSFFLLFVLHVEFIDYNVALLYICSGEEVERRRTKTRERKRQMCEEWWIRYEKKTERRITTGLWLLLEIFPLLLN